MVMATYDATPWIRGPLSGRKDPLPNPRLRRPWGLRAKPIREFDLSTPFCQIGLVECFHVSELLLQWRRQQLRQHGYPVLVPFALANRDFQPIKIDSLDPQPQPLH